MLTSLLLTFVVASNPSPQGSPSPQDEWHALVDAEGVHGLRSFRGEAFPQRDWEVADGVLRHTEGGGGGDLVTTDEYRDFVLDFEWKVTEGANSGVMYRVSEELDQTYFTGPEYQVLDNAKYQKNGPEVHAAALYGLYAAQDAEPRAVGEWNQARILVIGQYIEHWLNGKRVVQAVLDSDDWNRRVEGSKFKQWSQFGKQASGRIAFQDHGNEVEYRGIRILDLAPESTPRDRELLKEELQAWDPPSELQDTDLYELRDGVLQRRGSSLGDDSTTRNWKWLGWKLTGATQHLTWQHYGSRSSLCLLGSEGTVNLLPIDLTTYSSGSYHLTVQPKSAEKPVPLSFVRDEEEEERSNSWRELELTVWEEHVVLRVDGQVLQQVWGHSVAPHTLALELPAGDGLRQLKTTGLPSLR